MEIGNVKYENISIHLHRYQGDKIHVLVLRLVLLCVLSTALSTQRHQYTQCPC